MWVRLKFYYDMGVARSLKWLEALVMWEWLEVVVMWEWLVKMPQ